MDILIWIIGFVAGGLLQGVELACFVFLYAAISIKVDIHRYTWPQYIAITAVLYFSTTLPIAWAATQLGDWIDAHFEGAGVYGAWFVGFAALYYYWKHHNDDDDDDHKGDRKEPLP